MRKTDKKLEGMKTLVLRKTSFLELKEKPAKIETLMALDSINMIVSLKSNNGGEIGMVYYLIVLLN
jgi:hypothetical protein